MKPLTKKARIEKARAIIDRNVLDLPFSAEDLAEFIEITGMKHITGAIRRVNPTYPNSDPRHVRVIKDGVEEAQSWVNSIRGKKPNAHLQQALRIAINPCTKAFKETVKDQNCAHCGSDDYLQVDHVDPPFQAILEAFIEHKDGRIELKNEVNGIGWEMADMDVEAEWVAFHASRAKYQILCRSCNASKGATKSVRRNYA